MIDLIRTRRSIRKFRAEPVTEEALTLLEEAALRAPTSKNRRPREFVFVDDPDLLRGLSRAKTLGGLFLADAPLGVVVCGDETVSDCWVEDGSIACTFLQLAAHGLGLGSCWIQIRGRSHGRGGWAEDEVRRLLGLPGSLKVLAIIAIGHPVESPPPHPVDALDRGSVHWNGWS